MDSTQTREPLALAEALAYARDHGFHVFPVHNLRPDGSCTCGGARSCTPGKHPLTQHGLNDATTDEAIIREWWGRWPWAQVAVNCGASGLVVVDVDAHGDIDGRPGWAELVAEHGAGIEGTAMADTPSDGLHIFYRAAGHRVLSGGKRGNGSWPLGKEGVEIKAEGGYIILPSAASPLRDWTEGHSPEERGFADLPEGLADKVSYLRRRDDADDPRLVPADSDHVGAVRAYLLDMFKRHDITVLKSKKDGKGELYELDVCPGNPLHTKGEPFVRIWNNGEWTAKCHHATCFHSAGEFLSILGEEGVPARPFRLSEYGNAERLAARHYGAIYSIRGGDELRAYDADRGLYSADRGLLVRYAMQTIRAIYDEAGDGLDDHCKALRAFALKSESKQAVSAMLELAKSVACLQAEGDDFDANPELFNAANGVVDLSNGELYAHGPRFRMSKMAGCAYDPKVQTPLWRAFLLRIFAGDEELIAFIRRLVGYLLTGYTVEQVLAILYGLGANGKSVLVDVILALMGEYGTSAAWKSFMPHSTEAVRTDLASFAGRRLVSTSESKPGQVIDSGTIKLVTSKHVTARFLYGREFTYTPQYTVVLDTNFKPVVECDDYAIKRRVLLVPFSVQIPPEEQDRKLTEKLIANELPGILAWAVQGAGDYLRNGLRIPESVRAATDQYRAEMDSFHDFWTNRLIFGERVWTPAGELRKALETWAEENGVDKRDLPKASEWGRQLRERGAEMGKRNVGGHTVSGWHGVRIDGADTAQELI